MHGSWDEDFSRNNAFSLYDLYGQHKNPSPMSHEIYNFSRPFLGHHYYILSLIDLCLGVKKKIFKEMKERVSKLTYSELQLCLRILYTTNGNSKHKWRAIRQKTSFISELHKMILAKVQKGYKLLLKKIESAFPIKMHIYTLSPS